MEFIKVATNGDPTYPVRLDLTATAGGDLRDFPISVAEARELSHELLRAAQEIEDGEFVRVRVAAGSSAVWTYRDPSRQLRVGDTVLVPFGYTNAKIPGIVNALGRGGYDGPAKTVIARLEPAPL